MPHDAVTELLRILTILKRVHGMIGTLCLAISSDTSEHAEAYRCSIYTISNYVDFQIKSLDKLCRIAVDYEITPPEPKKKRGARNNSKVIDLAKARKGAVTV